MRAGALKLGSLVLGGVRGLVGWGDGRRGTSGSGCGGLLLLGRVEKKLRWVTGACSLYLDQVEDAD